jgi:MftR C-terminal domain
VRALAARLETDPVTDPFPAVAVAAAMGALRAAVSSWEDAGRPGSLDDAVDAAFATLAAGLPAPRAPRKGRR